MNNTSVTRSPSPQNLAPTSERVIVFTAPQRAELIEKPLDPSALGPNEVAGPTLATLVSPGTELNGAYLGDRFPIEPGYTSVFEVQAVGAEVKQLRPGDHVLGKGPWGTGSHRTWIRGDAADMLKLPEGLSPQVALFGRLMGVAMATLTTTAARPPEKVLIAGLGIVGHLGAQIFQSCGYEVTAVDPVESRRALLRGKNVNRVLESTPSDEGDFALAIDCSGHEQAVLDACRAVRKKGEVVLLGKPWKPRTNLLAADLLRVVFDRYLILRSGWEWELPRKPTDFRTGSADRNWSAAMRWLADGRIDVRGLYGVAAPESAQQVYQDLLHQRRDDLAVVFDWT